MNTFSAESLAAALAIIGIVIIVSALLSGLIERSGLPQVAVFLALGAALGHFGLRVLNIGLDSAALRVVATLSLALVLFTDAVSLNITDVRRRGGLALRLLGPGTLLTAALIALAGWLVLGLPAPGAAILGAALASSDPVLLRGLLRRRDIPADARHALHLESGLNDVALLPVVIIAMAFLSHGSPLSGADFAKLGLELFVLGPGAGIFVGLLGVAALDLVRRRIGVRRDYESLYSLGAAFTAGVTIAAFDFELCDCFIEYGGVTAEMLLLFTFVLLGSYVIWTGFTVINGATLLFTAIAVLIRTPVYLLSLIRSSVDMRGRLLIAWFGPRGLSSLLLVLLPVFAGLPGGERLFAICSLVVLVSVVLHGGAPMLLAQAARKRARRDGAGIAGGAVVSTPALGPAAAQEGAMIDREAPREEQPMAPISCGDSTTSSEDKGGGASINATASRRLGAEGDGAQVGSQRISLDELRRLWQAKEQVTILDVRTERSFEEDDLQAKGAVRMPPDHVAERARELGLKQEAWLVAYCA